jgi:hypothetical protein
MSSMSTQIEVQIELLGLLMVIDQVMVSGDSDYKKHREKEYSLDKILQAMNSMSSKLKHQWNPIADSY